MGTSSSGEITYVETDGAWVKIDPDDTEFKKNGTYVHGDGSYFVRENGKFVSSPPEVPTPPDKPSSESSTVIPKEPAKPINDVSSEVEKDFS